MYKLLVVVFIISFYSIHFSECIIKFESYKWDDPNYNSHQVLNDEINITGKFILNKYFNNDSFRNSKNGIKTDKKIKHQHNKKINNTHRLEVTPLNLKNNFKNDENMNKRSTAQLNANSSDTYRQYMEFCNINKLSLSPEIELGSILQNDSTSYKTYYQNDERSSTNLERNVMSASLVFVFDATGSMSDDLMQVKKGAAKIMDTVMKTSVIKNFVLVPFRDPDVGPSTVTYDYRVFQDKLEEIQVFKGGDCPENTFAAILEAVKLSEPGSYIYVFTDARSKDYYLLDDVSTWIQKKQSQVVFVMTGDCGDSKHAGHLAFETIASISSGQVFNLNKTNVNEVLDSVDVSLNSQKVNLISFDSPKPAFIPESHNLPIDTTLKRFTVSVAGQNPSVTVIDPTGTVSNAITPLLDLKNVKIVSVKNPEPGTWTFLVTSDSQYSVRTTGFSGVDFNHGFSFLPAKDLKNTYHRPLIGVNNSIWIQTMENGTYTRLSTVDVIATNGTILYTFPLKLKDHNVYVGGPFVPPGTNELFYIAINGVTSDNYKGNYPFKRITPTAFSPQNPESPCIEIIPQQTEWIGSSASVVCRVRSLIPFTLRWFKDNVPKTPNVRYPPSADVEFKIPNVTFDSAGDYKCRAQNSAGTTTKTIRLNVISYPPKVKAGIQMSGLTGQTAILTCSVTSNLPYNVTWSRVLLSTNRLAVLGDNSRFIQSAKDDLVISSVQLNDIGWYLCTASNSAGTNSDKVLLTIKQPPKIRVSPENVEFRKYDDITISCFIYEGFPEPTIIWKKNKQVIKGVSKQNRQKADLHVTRARKSDEGTYECGASNEVSVSSSYSVLTYVEEPSVIINNKELLVPIYTDVNLECFTSGSPRPEVNWLYRNHTPIETKTLFGKYQITPTQGLQINSVDYTDSGTYICRADNRYGAAEGKISLTVGSPPQINKNLNVTQLYIGGNISLCCVASGFPVPTITWKKLMNYQEDLYNTSNNTLTITDARLDDGGMYLCQAENMFGSDSATVDIEIIGLDPPVLEKTSPLKRVIKGENVVLSCKILEGNPSPKITWYKDGSSISPKFIYKDDRIGEEILLERVNRHNIGDYECRATNVAGMDSTKFQVAMIEAPKFKEPWIPRREILEGNAVELPCQVQENSNRVEISWSVHGNPIIDSNKWYIGRDGSLNINNPTRTDSNIYVCTISNSAGSASKAVELDVIYPPELISAEKKNVGVVLNNLTTLSCVFRGGPSPKLTWYKDNNILKVQSETITVGTSISDSGIYKCEVTNKAGTTEKEFNVTIYEPPKIHPEKQETITAIQGDTVRLMCNATGYPYPAIKWHHAIDSSLSNRIRQILDNELRIENITSTMSGRYTCDAKNVAGSIFKNFEVDVFVKPVLEKTKLLKKAIKGENVILSCKILEGEPVPKVTWFKDGNLFSPVQQDYKANEQIVVERVNKYNMGNYECRATNVAGSDSAIFQIDMMEAPKFKEPWISHREIVEGYAIELPCEVLEDNNRNDKAEISWSVHGNSIIDSNKWYIGRDGSLNIDNPTRTDSNNYVCTVSNSAGSASKAVELDVIYPPEFISEEEKNVGIVLNNLTTLSCAFRGEPSPKLTWFKDNAFLDFQSETITVGSSINDSGIYKCEVTNKAGTIEREINVEIYVKPILKKPTSLKKAIKGENVILSCKILEGNPKPKITWFKDGNLFSPVQQDYKANEQIVIERVNKYNMGNYECRATNVAGMDSAIFQIDMMEAPKFKEPWISHREIIEGNAVKLPCEVQENNNNVHISWSVHGNPIIDSNKWYIGSDGSLNINNPTRTDSKNYVCTISNSAGSASKAVEFDVIYPPEFTSEQEESVSLTLNRRSETISCAFIGLPSPTLVWYKDYAFLNVRSENLTVGSSINDNGIYKCEVSNKAGTIEREINVTVYVPPDIHPKKQETITAIQGDTVNLLCNATGYPYPTIKWQYTIDSSGTEFTHVRQISENELRIENITSPMSGKYTCEASNIVGSDTKTFYLNVIVPPKIQDNNIPYNVTLKEGEDFSLPCVAIGVPIPIISWQTPSRSNSLKEGYHDDAMRVMADNTLVFTGAKISSSSIYTCIATNAAGVDTKNHSISVESNIIVNTDPQIKQKYVVDSESITLTCGSSNGTVNRPIQWNTKKKSVHSADDAHHTYRNNTLTINEVSSIDDDIYTCLDSQGNVIETYKVNVLLEPNFNKSDYKSSISASPGETIMLDCSASGKPNPIVTWRKFIDGEMFPLTEHTISDIVFEPPLLKYFLQFPSAQLNHTGTYLCIATNKVSSITRQFDLRVASK